MTPSSDEDILDSTVYHRLQREVGNFTARRSAIARGLTHFENIPIPWELLVNFVIHDP